MRCIFLAALIALVLGSEQVRAQEERPGGRDVIVIEPLFRQVVGDRLGLRLSVSREGEGTGPAFEREVLAGAKALLIAPRTAAPAEAVVGRWAEPVEPTAPGALGGLVRGEELKITAWFRIPTFEGGAVSAFDVQWVGSGPFEGLRSNQVTVTVANNDKPLVTMETSLGEILIELWPTEAPNHVANLLSLAGAGYYDGQSFHRVIPGFMIQAGCPKGEGTGGPGYRIAAEFNAASFRKGVLGMARTSDPNSAGSQFFICTDDAPHLDRNYTAFGRVLEGQDVADKIAAAPRDARDRPRQAIVIRKVKTVLPAGFTVPAVKKIGG